MESTLSSSQVGRRQIDIDCGHRRRLVVIVVRDHAPASIIVAIKGRRCHRSPSSAAQSGKRGQPIVVRRSIIKTTGRSRSIFARSLRSLRSLRLSGLCRSRSRSESMGLTKLERYSHGGYLIKVVVMAVAGEVTRELSPILSWSNNNYEN